MHLLDLRIRELLSVIVRCGMMGCGCQANNQWKLDAEIQADPSKTSFYYALRASVGVLMVLDPQGNVATRGTATASMDCLFEMV